MGYSRKKIMRSTATFSHETELSKTYYKKPKNYRRLKYYNSIWEQYPGGNLKAKNSMLFIMKKVTSCRFRVNIKDEKEKILYNVFVM